MAMINLWLERWRAPKPLSPALNEELAKIQRATRRVSLSLEQQTEVLGALAAKSQDIHQAVVQLGSRRQGDGIPVSEQSFVELLDRLSLARSHPNLSHDARSYVDDAWRIALKTAGWEPLAEVGGPVRLEDVRVIEVETTDGPTEGPRVARVLREGYRRQDGSRVRDAHVVARQGAVSN